MGKWIHRAAALAIVVPYVLIAPGGRYFWCMGSPVWWFLEVMGLLLVLFAEWLDDHFGDERGASYVGIVRFLGWVGLLTPPVWDLMVWTLQQK